MSSRRDSPGVFVLRSAQVTLSIAVALASLWGLLGGCREQSTAPIDRNRAPETFLTSAPGDSQTSFYRIKLHWSGTDHDGAVVGFEVAVTESLPNEEDILWRRTRRSDSLLTFAVEETREVLGHRFYARAIDNEGKADPTPAWVFFGSRNNIPPEVRFYRAIAVGPNGETKLLESENAAFPTDTIPTGWGVSFAWTGSDGDVALDENGEVVQIGSIANYSYRLLPVESEFLGGTLADTASSYPGEFFLALPKGNVYAFEAKAIDDGGLSGSGVITRSFVWNQDPISRADRCVRPGGTDSLACFESRDSVFFSGDTLALPVGSEPFPDVRFFATAYDPDPIDGDYSVAQMEWRLVVGAIINSWNTLEPGAPITIEGLTTGSYVAMVRAVDRLDRVEGTPDSVVFHVNFAPRFLTELGPNRQQDPMPNDVFTVSQLRSEGLICSLKVFDPDASPQEKFRYSVRLQYQGQGPEPFYHHRDVLRDYKYYTPVVRADTVWLPGDYLLHARAEDNKQNGGELRGTRTRVRSVPFTVVSD